MKPKTRYARRDGLCIAYQVVGDGPAELVYTFGPASHVEHLWAQPYAVRFFDRLGSFARVPETPPGVTAPGVTSA